MGFFWSISRTSDRILLILGLRRTKTSRLGTLHRDSIDSGTETSGDIGVHVDDVVEVQSLVGGLELGVRLDLVDVVSESEIPKPTHNAALTSVELRLPLEFSEPVLDDGRNCFV